MRYADSRVVTRFKGGVLLLALPWNATTHAPTAFLTALYQGDAPPTPAAAPSRRSKHRSAGMGEGGGRPPVAPTPPPPPPATAACNAGSRKGVARPEAQSVDERDHRGGGTASQAPPLGAAAAVAVRARERVEVGVENPTPPPSPPPPATEKGRGKSKVSPLQEMAATGFLRVLHPPPTPPPVVPHTPSLSPLTSTPWEAVRVHLDEREGGVGGKSKPPPPPPVRAGRKSTPPHPPSPKTRVKVARVWHRVAAATAGKGGGS